MGINAPDSRGNDNNMAVFQLKLAIRFETNSLYGNMFRAIAISRRPSFSSGNLQNKIHSDLQKRV